MANLIIPFSVRGIDVNIPYVLVMKIPFSSFMAYLSSDSLYIRNSNNINHGVILKVSRSQESIEKYGPNQWMQYIDRYHICFGTKSGLINVLRLTDLTAFSKKFENVFFASFFNCFKHLAYITPNKELFFIKIDNDDSYNNNIDPFRQFMNQKDQSYQTISINELNPTDKTIEILPVTYNLDFSSTTISNAIFYHRLNKPKLAAIIRNKACLIPFTPSSLKTQKAIQPIYYSIVEPTAISVNPTYDYLAAATKNNLIVFMSLNYPDSNPIVISKYEPGSQIILMRWTHDDENLIVLSSNGVVTLFEMPTYTVYSIFVPDFMFPTSVFINTSKMNNDSNNVNNSNNLNPTLKPSCKIVSIEYDEESKSFFVIKQEDENNCSLHTIEFASLQKRFCYTVSHVFDLSTKIIYPTSIYPIKFVIPFSIKEKIRDTPKQVNAGINLPIQQPIQNEKLFLMASNNQIQIDNHVLTFNEDDIIQGFQFLEGILFVFIFSSKKEQTSLLLLDENLNKRKLSIVFSMKKDQEDDIKTELQENIDSIEFPHSVHNVTTNHINQLAISCHTMYTLIKMNVKNYKEIKHKEEEKQNDEFSSDIDLFEGLNLDDNDEKKKPRNELINSIIHIKVHSPEFETKSGNNNDDENYTFSIKTYSVRQQLKNAISCVSQGVFLQYAKGNGQFVNSHYAFNNIKYAFYEPFSDVVIIQMPHTYYIVKDYYQAEFKGVACFSDMIETFSLQKLTMFGEVNYVGTLFMPFLLINNFNNSNSLLISRLKKVCPNIERFDNIITSTVSTALIQNHPRESIQNNIQPIIDSIPPERAANILQAALQKVKEIKTSIKIVSDSDDEDEESSSSGFDNGDEDDVSGLAKQMLSYDFCWEKCFKYFNFTTKEIILEYLKPVALENLLLEIDNESVDDSNFNEQEKKNFIIKLIKKFHFLRAFKICDSLKINFASLIKEIFYEPNSNSNLNNQYDLKTIIQKIDNDRKEFNMKDDNGLLRFMGSTFGASNLFLFSFSVFLVLKEQSKIELMLMTNADPEIDNRISEFVKAYPDSKYTKFLLSLPNSVFKDKQ